MSTSEERKPLVIFDDDAANENYGLESACQEEEKSASVDAAAAAAAGQSGKEQMTSFLRSLSKMSSRVWEHVGQIGVLGSMSIAVNFLTGPAMLEIPAVFQKSGIIPTTLTIALVGALSSLGSLHMARVLSQVPGNDNFELEVEYSEAFRRFFAHDEAQPIAGKPTTKMMRSQYWFVGTQVIFFACVTCLSISSLVDSAQVFDTILANTLGGTRALQITTTSTNTTTSGFHLVKWTYSSCTEELLLEGRCIPFEEVGDGDDDGVLFTAGYFLNILFFLPLSLMNLQENAAWQVVEFLVLIVTSGIFSYLFWQNGLVWEDDRISWWGDSWDGLLGVILFNFALVISVASWLYEKKPTVDVRSVIVGSTVIAAFLYILLGILGAMSIPHVSGNMLETFMSGVLGTSMQWTASIFALFIVGLGIPLLCVLCRLNLTGSGMSYSTANLLSVYLPFGASWLMYRGDLVTQLLSWGGVIFTSLIAFILPLLLALQALRVRHEDPGTVWVYGRRWAERATEQSERRALYALLLVSLVSISLAMAGNILGGYE